MKLTKERVERVRLCYRTHATLAEAALVELVCDMADAMLEAETSKAERCGGTSGEPHYTSSFYHPWHNHQLACDIAPPCTPCPGCEDCQPPADWALEAAQEWFKTGGVNGTAEQRLSAIIRKHAP